MKVLRRVIVSIVGAVAGTVLGAVSLTAILYMGTLGSPGYLLELWPIVGGIIGFPSGLILGISIGASECRRLSGTLIGVGLGIATTAYYLLFILNGPGLFDYRKGTEIAVLAAPIVWASFLGWALVVIAESLRRSRHSDKQVGMGLILK